ncbi:MAG: aromatic amino acid ammonia-lyase [Candidatus Adiutrix sp.]|jgi:histidine ammonia-lyase|nr:aromatic amino acid ammonia-lyase [Candidatus Adiutrix sp.]
MSRAAITLGPKIGLAEFVAVARFQAPVSFSAEYCGRVRQSRELVEGWVAEGRPMYGITTGFGAMCTQAISREETARLQRNIVVSHAVSVGDPFTEEEARATLLMVLQNLGQGYSGVRLEILERCRDFLNLGLTPWMPREGSVGYLAPEAHMVMSLTGQGRVYYGGELMDAQEALRRVGLPPLELSSKEGLALVSGTTSATALAALALHDFIKAVRSADVIAALSLEILHGVTPAFDARVMAVRPHEDQAATAENVRRVLAESAVVEAYKNQRLQDALSLRTVPQLHGPVRKAFRDALATIETEINSCCDNPIIWPDKTAPDVLSACNADSSYVGLAMDSAAIAATMLAKMSERRNNRLVDGSLSGYPYFLVKNPGLNSGLMIPQYAQAGLLNDMRILATSACIDNTSTCAMQEDYVAMGYNAAKKARVVAEKLEYILAIELMSVHAAQSFTDAALQRGKGGRALLAEIARLAPSLENDVFLYPLINDLRDLIHSGQLIELVEGEIGPLK